jgi:DNA-binding LacI/PurR family transcriptional regulator
VSNALNAPHKLHPETLRHVRTVIDELGYRPDTRARGLRTRSSGLVGYCLPPHHLGSVNVFLDEFLRALTSEVERSGRHVLLFTAPPDDDGLGVYADLLARSTVDALVLSETRVGDPRHEWLAERDVPFVSFGRTWTGSQVGHWVDVDGARGIAQGVRHLVSHGHQRIGFLGPHEQTPVTEDRARGWREACHEAGLDASDRFLAIGGENHVGGDHLAAKLLDLPHPPTALVAANDALALGAYKLLAARDLRPGVDVAVTGFDDSPSAAVVTPGLTSLRQPVDHIATRVVELLSSDSEPVGELFEPELVIRSSSSQCHSDRTTANSVTADRRTSGRG